MGKLDDLHELAKDKYSIKASSDGKKLELTPTKENTEEHFFTVANNLEGVEEAIAWLNGQIIRKIF